MAAEAFADHRNGGEGLGVVHPGGPEQADGAGRLALNGPFATLWTGGLFSLFGDRVNQAVLAIFIYQQTGSVIATGAVFFAATVPNLIFGSLAGRSARAFGGLFTGWEVCHGGGFGAG